MEQWELGWRLPVSELAARKQGGKNSREEAFRRVGGRGGRKRRSGFLGVNLSLAYVPFISFSCLRIRWISIL